MIEFNLNNLYKISSKHGLSQEEINSKSSLIKKFLENIDKRKQGFYHDIDKDEQIKKIQEFKSKTVGKYKDIVILGIGGSALGPICLQQSLKHLFVNQLKNSSTPKLHVLDNIDPHLISQINDIIDYSKTLFIVITKSGSTPETLSQYFYFSEQLKSKKLEEKEHFVFITDPEKGLLRKISKEKNINTFDIPENIGGRFSVLTPVGLLATALIDIDINQLINGAKTIRDKFLDENFDKNLPFQLATIQYLLEQKGKTINVMMPYSQRLIRFADWYRQLLAESIGKKLDNQKNEVFTGITPIKALGATDQHSQNQLYNEGPNDKFFILIEEEYMGPELKIPNPYPNDHIVDYLQNTSFNKLIKTEKQGTEQSFTQNNRPNITIKINQVNEENLGELFMLFESSIAFLGEYYNINAFDQPGVELSKNLTKKLLLTK